MLAWAKRSYITSIRYLAVISIYALVKGSWAAHHAKKSRNGE